MESYRLTGQNVVELKNQWKTRIDYLNKEIQTLQEELRALDAKPTLTAIKGRRDIKSEKLMKEKKKELTELLGKESRAKEILDNFETPVDINYSVESYEKKFHLSYLLGILQLSSKGHGKYKQLLPIVEGIESDIDQIDGNRNEMKLSIQESLENGIHSFAKYDFGSLKRKNVSISDVPIYLLVVNSSLSFPHATLLILFQNDIYSFGYGYKGENVKETSWNRKTSNKCHLGRGSVYTPDSVLEASRYPLQIKERKNLADKIASRDISLVDVNVMVTVVYDKEKNLSADIPGVVTDIKDDNENEYFVLLDGNEEATLHNKSNIYIAREPGYLIKDIGVVTPEMLENIKRSIFGDVQDEKTFPEGTIYSENGSYYVNNDTNYMEVCGNDVVSRYFQKKTSNCVKFANDIVGHIRLDCKMNVVGISSNILHPAYCKRKHNPLSDSHIERFIEISTSSSDIDMNELFQILDYKQSTGGNKKKKVQKSKKKKNTKKGKQQVSKMTRKRR